MSVLTLPVVPLGTSGPSVGAQGLGCMGFSEAYGPSTPAQAQETLQAALDAGVTMFDTADLYGNGGNEVLLGPFVRAHRERVFLATKFGIVRQPGQRTWNQVRGDRAYVRQCAHASLKRLGIDTIDLYYAHRRDPSVPLEETVGAMAELVHEGKVRHLGLCEVTGPELRAAHTVHPITALQSEWSLFSRDAETSAVPAAAELGVAFVAYSPLGRGLLTGALPDSSHLSTGDTRLTMPRFTGEQARTNQALLDTVRTIAADHAATPAQIALAWLHQQSRVHSLTVLPIPGSRRSSRLRENAAAAALTLSAAGLQALEPLAAQVAGTRYADMSSTAAARE
ncbi:aldo/keto reductase [Streptomyces hyaluromycini]|uniref:aldo/keto reductase n=1 Tax=Streptomyces hyaluromycini TaxID=1377993 RepID=UPI000B5CEFA2|nr:aldo/keto reductase [Streptomyces hyaluromycini]